MNTATILLVSMAVGSVIWYIVTTLFIYGNLRGRRVRSVTCPQTRQCVTPRLVLEVFSFGTVHPTGLVRPPLNSIPPTSI